MTVRRGQIVCAVALVVLGLSALVATTAGGQTPQDAAGAAITEGPAEPLSQGAADATTTASPADEPSPSEVQSTAPPTAPAGKQDAETGTQQKTDKYEVRHYEWKTVLLVVLILGLLALLFWLLLRWSHRLDQASYLGDVYQESVQDFEYKRLAFVATEKLRNAEYQREIVRDNDWLRANPRPQPPPGVDAQDVYFGSDPWVARGRTGTGPGTLAADDPEALAAREVARESYRADMDAWRSQVEREADARFRSDLAVARTRAQARAALATDVDLSALRGRGAEFVLEFTTVVVIIFAAVILGVLGILGTEQIGTLLAAIAGYVLGRATTRARAGAGEGKPQEAKGKDEAQPPAG